MNASWAMSSALATSPVSSRSWPTMRGYAPWKNAVNPSSATPAPIPARRGPPPTRPAPTARVPRRVAAVASVHVVLHALGDEEAAGALGQGLAGCLAPERRRVAGDGRVGQPVARHVVADPRRPGRPPV